MSAIATLFLYHTGFVLLCHMEGICVCVCVWLWPILNAFPQLRSLHCKQFPQFSMKLYTSGWKTLSSFPMASLSFSFSVKNIFLILVLCPILCKLCRDSQKHIHTHTYYPEIRESCDSPRFYPSRAHTQCNSSLHHTFCCARQIESLSHGDGGVLVFGPRVEGKII